MRRSPAVASTRRFREREAVQVVGASPSTPPQPSSTDCDGDEWTLLLSLLGLRIRWADRTAGVTEVVERTKDEFPEWTRILRDTIDAIRPLAEDVCEKQHALTEPLRAVLARPMISSAPSC